MENVARRKTGSGLMKEVDESDKVVVDVGTELPAAMPDAVLRPWMFLLTAGCIFVMCARMVQHRSFEVRTSRTNVNVQFQGHSDVPAITLEGLGMPQSDPTPSIYVEDAVMFPDSVMLLVRVSSFLNLEGKIDNLECRFGAVLSDSTNRTTSPVISIKRRTKDLQMVRCAWPLLTNFPSKSHNNVTLGVRESDARVKSNAFYHPERLPSWEFVVYENVVDTDSLVLLAKGLVTKSSKRIDPTSLVCVFGKLLPSTILFETPVLAAAQEVVRCEKPPAQMDEKLRGVRVSVKASWLGILPSVTYYNPDNRPELLLSSFVTPETTDAAVGVSTGEDLVVAADEKDAIASNQPSVEGKQTEAQEIDDSVEAPGTMRPSTTRTVVDDVMLKDPRPRRKLCACTMVWNKAEFLREWIHFHSFMGVEKFFVYDNDSDDGTDEMVDSLGPKYNVSRISWPWIKTQQASFSYCTVIAREECEWMMFTDVDEFIYPFAYFHKADSNTSDAMVLHRMIEGENRKMDNKSGLLGQIQYDCHNFGPSGLASTPKQGVTVGYTCRMKIPERHKSFIRLDAIDTSLLNVLHHFEIQEGYQNVKVSRRQGVVNHYKFQAWDSFRVKFVRRAGTYTTDWTKNDNAGSKDRTPGLGTEAVKPDDWESRFCQIQDKGLRDFSLRNFVKSKEGKTMEWQVD